MNSFRRLGCTEGHWFSVHILAAKARGIRLGDPRPDMPRMHALAAERALRFREELGPIVRSIRAGGGSLRAVAAELNARGFKAINGGVWHPGTVSRVLGEI